MPVFTYRAADRRGQTVDGVMEAPDARAVVERLHREAFYPIRIEPHAERRRLGGFTLSPSSRTCRFLSVAIPYVSFASAYLSPPIRKKPRSSSRTAAARTRSRFTPRCAR